MSVFYKVLEQNYIRPDHRVYMCCSIAYLLIDRAELPLSDLCQGVLESKNYGH